MTILASVNNKTVMPGITPIADVPDRPTIGTATAAGLAASITFTAATTGGTPTTFTATSNPGSLTGTSATSPITVSGLTGDTSYTFTVTAGNSTGTSPASAASNSITAVEPITGGYDSLATVTVGSTSVSSITFAGIPSGYKHLQIRGIHKHSASGAWASIQFNSDTTASNYTYHRTTGDGATASAEANASLNRIFTSYNFWGSVVIDVLDYTNTNKNTTLRTLSAWDGNGTGEVNFVSNLWKNTAAVTSLTIALSSFVEYSQLALYGIR